MKKGYFKKALEACYFRTLDCIDLDNGGKKTEGMSWAESIFWLGYLPCKKIINKIKAK